MLREFKGVKQDDAAGRRRWFDGDEIELVVWYDGGGTVLGFQILYRTGLVERALTWRRGHGFSHGRIDDGGDNPFKNMSPVVTTEEDVSWAEVQRLFTDHAAGLEPDLRALVSGRLDSRA